MNNTKLYKLALNQIKNEFAHTFEAECFDELDKDLSITYQEFAKVDDTLQMLEDGIYGDEDIETVDQAIGWWALHVKACCARSDMSVTDYGPEHFTKK